MPDTPLNPDALAQAKAAAVDCRINGGSTEDVAECAVEAYLAVAQPELQANSKPKQNFEVVNSMEELAKAWHAGFCKGEQTAFRERPVNPDTINPYKNGENQ